MSKDRILFKILTARAWAAACVTGSVALAGDDAMDGFFHLSADAQMRETAERYFRGRPGLLVVAFDAKATSLDLRWEAARGGQEFPHVYGVLPAAAAIWARPMPLDRDGVPVWPLGANPC